MSVCVWPSAIWQLNNSVVLMVDVEFDCIYSEVFIVVVSFFSGGQLLMDPCYNDIVCYQRFC